MRPGRFAGTRAICITHDTVYLASRDAAIYNIIVNTNENRSARFLSRPRSNVQSNVEKRERQTLDVYRSIGAIAPRGPRTIRIFLSFSLTHTHAITRTMSWIDHDRISPFSPTLDLDRVPHAERAINDAIGIRFSAFRRGHPVETPPIDIFHGRCINYNCNWRLQSRLENNQPSDRAINFPARIEFYMSPALIEISEIINVRP